MGLFDILPGAKQVKKSLEADLSAKLGRAVVLPTPGNLNVLLGATSGALTLMGAASQLVPGVGTAVGAALAAGGRAAAKLQSGDVKGAGLAALGALGPAVGESAAKALSPAVGEVLTTARAIDDLWKGVSVSAAAALPGIPSMVGAKLNADGLRVLADKVLAAKSLGGALGSKANAIVAETTRLAAGGNAQAKAAIDVLASVSSKRASLKLAAGVEQAVSSAEAKALAAQLSYASEPQAAAVAAKLATAASAAVAAKAAATAANVANYQGVMAVAAALAAEAAKAAAVDPVLAKALAAVPNAEQAAVVWSLHNKGRAASTSIVQTIQAAAKQGNAAAKTALGWIMAAETRHYAETAAATAAAEKLAAAVASVTTAAEADNIWALYVKGRPASTAAVTDIRAGAAAGDAKAKAALALLTAAEARRNAATAAAEKLAAAVASVTTAAEADNIWALYVKGRPASTAAVTDIRAGAAAGDAKAQAALVLLTAAEARRNAAGVVAAAGTALGAPVLPPAPAVETGFVLTTEGRVLDGTQWIASDSGSEGVLVRTTGPLPLRRDATLRRWQSA